MWRYLLILPPFLLAQPPQTNFEGKKVLAIVYEPERQPLDIKDLQANQSIKTGEPLRYADVATTIDHLFATGRYEDIRVKGEPKDDGVVVRFVTQSKWFTGHIELHGHTSDPPNRGQLLNVTQLTPGAPFDEQQLKTAEENMRNLFRSNGFFEPKIRFEPHKDEDTQHMEVRVTVDSGKRVRYGHPEVHGDTKLSDDAIIRATGWKIRFIGRWRKATNSLTQKGVEKIHKKYQNQDRLTAVVDVDPQRLDAADGRVKPEINVEAGPKVKVQALEAKVPKRKLKKYVPIYQEGSVDRDLLVEGARNLRDYFQFRGYPEVDVTFRQLPPQNDEQIIEYFISRGPYRKLKRIEITGNRYFDVDTIRERMFLQPSSLQFRRGRYSEAFRRKDEETIANLYKANGFRDVKVTSTVDNNYQGKANQMAVTLAIEEGPQWLVESLETTGIRPDFRDAIAGQLDSTQGQPYSDVNVATDRNAILTFYYTHGYPKAAFEAAATPAGVPNRVRLEYKIVEGPQQFVREVLVSGIKTTTMKTVRRNLDVKKDDPLSPVAIDESHRKLYNLGVFAKINTAIENPDGAEQHKYVLYDFDEANRYSLNVGFGAEVARIGGASSDLNAPSGSTGISPRVSLDLNRINFFGRGQTLAFRSRVSNLEQRGSLNYLAPHLHGIPGLDLTVTGLYDQSRDVRTFASKREEGSVQLSKPLSKPTTMYVRFAYRRVSTSDVVIPTLLVPLLLQPVRIGMLSTNFVQDRRDNPADAHRGIYNTLDAGLASRVFGSQRSFWRILGRDATYHRIGSKWVFARETMMGMILPFSAPAGITVSDSVPLPERFFGGGSISHRGFPENQAGPRDIGAPVNPGGESSPPTGFPLGGNTLLFNNLELRFPLIGENISGVLFHDAGNVFKSVGHISFRFRQRNDQDFDYMVHAVGFGIRYKTPLGPIRGDLAYSINPPRFVGFKGNVQQLLACGPGAAPQNSACQSVSQSISHFQFFFSIGQTF